MNVTPKPTPKCEQLLYCLVGLAATVPWLDLLVSLLGAVKMSTLSLMAPALIGQFQIRVQKPSNLKRKSDSSYCCSRASSFLNKHTITNKQTYTQSFLHVHHLYTIQLVFLGVCVYPTNVKTAEPIGHKFCVGPHVTPGKVYG